MQAMTPELLQELGLTNSQATIYIALVRGGAQTAPELQQKTDENRTNVYMVLEKLIELGLVEKTVVSRKTVYRATNPTALEKLSKQKRRAILETETKVKTAMPQLLNFFFTFSEQPGVKFYQGAADISQIYEDILRTAQPIQLLRAAEPASNLQLDYFHRYVDKRVKAGLHVDALTTKHTDANTDPDQDKAWLMTRTWMDPGDYLAPVEINIYGNKVAYISFGQEVIGMIIESPQIAEAMRQVFQLMKRGLTPASQSDPARSESKIARNAEQSKQTPRDPQSEDQTSL